MRKITKPRPIQACAVISKKNPKLKVLDIFMKSDCGEVRISRDEVKCLVEVKFIKFVKK